MICGASKRGLDGSRLGCRSFQAVPGASFFSGFAADGVVYRTSTCKRMLCRGRPGEGERMTIRNLTADDLDLLIMLRVDFLLDGAVSADAMKAWRQQACRHVFYVGVPHWGFHRRCRRGDRLAGRPNADWLPRRACTSGWCGTVCNMFTYAVWRRGFASADLLATGDGAV